MPGEGSDAIIWILALPLAAVLVAAHWILWRAARRRRPVRLLSVTVMALTVVILGLVMASAEWLPWLPDDLNLDDAAAGIWPGLRFMLVNLAAMIAISALPVAAVLMLAKRTQAPQ